MYVCECYLFCLLTFLFSIYLLLDIYIHVPMYIAIGGFSMHKDARFRLKKL